VTTDHGHYSYSVYADPATARTFDERRFGGPIGDLVAGQQARVLREFLGPLQGRSVLDVGTGTGRAAFLMAADGATVTGVDASEEMLAVARQRLAGPPPGPPGLEFRHGDAHRLDFPDRSFDHAVSLRVIMHTPRWRACVGELCRVTRQRIVLDYPSAHSAALLQSVARRVAHAVGARTEPYRVFFDRQIAQVLEDHGFRVRTIDRQFTLPIAVHKTFGSRRLTEGSEALLKRVGLLSLVGSPVTLMAERCASS
jgi:ubiquinone/menaquinone biosynthesis C-methylase UbiE